MTRGTAGEQGYTTRAMSDSDGSSSDDGNDVPQPEASAPSPPPPPVTSSNIRVYPPEVEFQGIEQGVLYVLTISIQNISPQARRFQVIPPSTRHFVLNYAPVAAIASGLDIKAEVEFQMAAGDTRDYHDKVVILSGDERIELPRMPTYQPRASNSTHLLTSA